MPKMTPAQRALHDALIAKLTDEGKLLEVGFQSMRALVIAPNAPDIQVSEMRLAYMSGAQHLFSSILAILDPTTPDATERDVKRMDLIAAELQAFGKELEARVALGNKP